ncbi:MAG: hypothetical protein C4294_00225 [Nitrospiraceae bacterium]
MCPRAALEQQADQLLAGPPDAQRVRTLPGVGPILALTIVAEAGDLRRFASPRQFLTCCGLDLSTQQSGQFRGHSQLSEHGNARLRLCSGWRPKAPSACARIRFGKNTRGTSRAIRRAPIASAKPSARSPPKSLVSRTASLKQARIIGPILRQSPQ